MSSWWSRKTGAKPSPAPSIQTNVSSPASSIISPASSSRYGYSPQSTMPRSPINPASATGNGYLNPYRSQNHKDSAPSRPTLSTYSDSGLKDSISSSASRKESVSRPRTAQNEPSASLLGGFLGLGPSKPKRPSTGQPEIRTDPGPVIETIDIRADWLQRAPPPIDTSLPSSGRNRAYTLSGSTATSGFPVTPSTSWGDTDSLLQIQGGRARSDSASSQPSSLSRRAKRPPALLAVEEYDPFAAGNTHSFYITPTPPALTPDSAFFQPPVIPRQRVASDTGYEPGTFGHRGAPKKEIISPLRLPRRPSAPPPSSHNQQLGAPSGSSKPGPSSAGPFSKKQLPLLPFRAKTTKEKKHTEPDESLSKVRGGLLRPNSSSRLSNNSSASSPSDLSRHGSVNDKSSQQGRSSPLELSPARLPVSLAGSPNDFQERNRSLHPTDTSPSLPNSVLTHQEFSQSRVTQESNLNSEVSRSSASHLSARTSPATSPSQPGSAGARSRPLSTNSNGSSESRKRRLKAALAISIQDIDDAQFKNPEFDLGLNVDIALDAHPTGGALGPHSGGLRANDQVVDGGSGKASPMITEDGTFEFLLPPKTPVRMNAPARDSHAYGAPSFIEDSVMSPGDHFFFASPYPSGVTTVPVFRESDEWKREGDGSADPIRPFEDEDELRGARPEISVCLPDSPTALPPITPNLSAFPQVPDIAQNLVLAVQERLSPSNGSPTLPPSSPRRPPPPPPIDLSAPSPSSATFPSPPHTATTIQPVRASALVNVAPLRIPEKPPRLTASSSPDVPVGPSAAHTPLSPPSPSPISPVYFKPNPIMKNAEAILSTLSFSSSRSASKTRTAEDEVDEVLDLKSPVMTSSRKRRGSEPTSIRSKIIPDDSPLSSYYTGATSTPPPPSSFSARTRKWSHERGRGSQQAPSPRQTRSPSASSARPRNPMYAFVSALASSSTSVSEEGEPSTSSSTPHVPKRRRSFNHIPMPSIPSLRHYNSFTPAPPVTTEPLPPPPEHQLHNSTSVSNLSMASSAKTEVPAGRAVSGSKRRITKQGSKASLSGGRPSPAAAVGPKGETLDYDFDWIKEKMRMHMDDETRSLAATLNRQPGSSSYDDADDAMSSSYHDSLSEATHSSVISTSKAAKNMSPSKADFSASMHIVPPSELLRLGDTPPEEDEAVLSPRFATLSEQEDLLRREFDDNSGLETSLRDPGGSTWLTELGAHPGLGVSFNPKTSSMMPVYKGREAPFVPGVPPPLRGPPRPTTGSSKRDSAASKVSAYTQGRRPSTAQTNLGGVSTTRSIPGGPLSPPPLRPRLPRSSISSSMRSFPGILMPPGAAPLAPPPSRSRANSSSTLPATPSSSITLPRRGSEMSNPSVRESVPTPIPMPELAQAGLPANFALNNKKLSMLGTSAQRKKRMSMKPSFLDIGFDDDDEEEQESVKPTHPAEARIMEDSFLDMSRGNSMDSMRE